MHMRSHIFKATWKGHIDCTHLHLCTAGVRTGMTLPRTFTSTSPPTSTTEKKKREIVKKTTEKDEKKAAAAQKKKEEKAAILIEKHNRGNQARKKVAKMKAEKAAKN